MNKKSSNLQEAYRAVGPYLTLGIQFVVIILLFVYAGHWVDGKYDTAPAFTLVGSLLGIVAGFYHFFKAVLTSNGKSEDDSS